MITNSASFLRKGLLYPIRHTWKTIAIKMSTSRMMETSIREKLSSNLNTTHLDVINESNMHNVPKGSETHFRVIVVTEKFNGLPLIKRHRMINELLKEEMNTGLHALAIESLTPEQWECHLKLNESSPNCLGGYGK